MRRFAFLAALCAASSAWAASPTVERSAVGNSSGLTTVTVATFPVTGTNSLIIFLINGETTSSPPTVSSISYNGLTFAKRTNASLQKNFTACPGAATPHADTEVWSGWTAGTQSTSTAVITFGASVDGASAAAIVINGAFSSAAPFDPNSSLPVVNSNSSGSSASTFSGLNTTNANDLLLYLASANASTQHQDSDIPAGWTKITSTSQGAGTNFTSVYAAKKSVSATQSGATATWGASVGCWMVFADAPTSDAPPANGWPIPGSRAMMGVGK